MSTHTCKQGYSYTMFGSPRNCQQANACFWNSGTTRCFPVYRLPKEGHPMKLILFVITFLLTQHSSSAPFRTRALKHASPPAVCGASSLGFQCYRQVCPSIAMHWSLGGPPPPLPGCRYPDTIAVAGGLGALNATADSVHIALVSDLDGYVSMSLAKDMGVMCPADSIIALLKHSDNSASVAAYHLEEMKPWADNTVPLANTAVESSAEGLTACFTRPVDAVGKAGLQLSTGNAVAMNFAAAKRSSKDVHTHSFDPGHLCGTMVQLLAAVQIGGGSVDTVPAASNPHTAVVVHGILMLSVWLLLLPTGVLVARHRWLFSSAPASASASARPAKWFILHLASQLTGMVLFVIAFILPFAAFGHSEGGDQGMLPEVHSTIAIIVASLAFAQLPLAYFRPKPEASWRRWWNLQHWFTGRTAVVLAIINLFVGVQVFHEAWLEPRSPWYTVLFILLSVLVVTGILLEVQRYRMGGWQHLPAHDGAPIPLSTISGSSYVQMRPINGARTAEELSLLHAGHDRRDT